MATTHDGAPNETVRKVLADRERKPLQKRKCNVCSLKKGCEETPVLQELGRKAVDQLDRLQNGLPQNSSGVAECTDIKVTVSNMFKRKRMKTKMDAEGKVHDMQSSLKASRGGW